MKEGYLNIFRLLVINSTLGIFFCLGLRRLHRMRLENLSLNSLFFFFPLSKYMLFVPRKTRLWVSISPRMYLFIQHLLAPQHLRASVQHSASMCHTQHQLQRLPYSTDHPIWWMKIMSPCHERCIEDSIPTMSTPVQESALARLELLLFQ